MSNNTNTGLVTMDITKDDCPPALAPCAALKATTTTMQRTLNTAPVTQDVIMSDIKEGDASTSTVGDALSSISTILSLDSTTQNHTPAGQTTSTNNSMEWNFTKQKYKCNKCPAVFSSQRIYEAHSCHVGKKAREPLPLAECLMCDWKGSFGLKLKEHLNSRHNLSRVDPNQLAQWGILQCNLCLRFLLQGTRHLKECKGAILQSATSAPPAPIHVETTVPREPERIHRMWRSLPQHAWPLWQEVCRPAFRAIQVALKARERDETLLQSAIMNLLRIPSEALRRAKRGGAGGNRLSNSLERQLRDALTGRTQSRYANEQASKAP